MDPGWPFVGAEALAAGTLNRHRLRTRHRVVFPGVYLPRHCEPTLRRRTVAAWLWSKRAAVVAGLPASAWHGSGWVDDDAAVELVSANTRPPPGILTRNDTLLDDEVQVIGGLPVTSAARTGFDLARRGPVGVAVARLDALCRDTRCAPADIESIASRHRGARGLRQLESVVRLVDPGAESPRETWLRLLLVGAGVPAPRTQIEVHDQGFFVARLDMGWDSVMVAVEYDGDHHRSDRAQYVRDMRRHEELRRLGWIVIRVVREDPAASIVRRVCDALETRGWPSRLNSGREIV